MDNLIPFPGDDTPLDLEQIEARLRAAKGEDVVRAIALDLVAAVRRRDALAIAAVEESMLLMELAQQEQARLRRLLGRPSSSSLGGG